MKSLPIHSRLRDFAIPVDRSILSSAILFNRSSLHTLLRNNSERSNAATRALVSRPPSAKHFESAARVAIVLSLGQIHDRSILRSILLTSGPYSSELLEFTSHAMSRITHPASAYLLIPLLEDDSFQIRKTALTSLLQLKQRFTAESVLAAVCVDLRLSRTLFRIMKKQTQQECNVIFDAFEKAANFHPDLEDALPALHELAKRSLQQCNQPEIDMQRLAAMNLMKMKCRENRQSEIYQSDSDSTDFHQQWSSEMTEPVSFRQIRHDMLQPLTSNSVNEQVSSTAAPQVSDFKAMETRRSLNLSSVRKKLTQMLSATSLHWALSLLAGASLTVIFMPASQHSAWLESTDDFLPDQFPQHLRNAIKSTRNTSQMPPEVELSADTKLVPDVKSAYPAMRFADSSQGDHHQNTPSSDVK